MILDELENCLTVTGENASTIDSIREKLNHRYEKIKGKKEEKNEKEKALNVYSKQYKQQCQWCGKYGHKPGDWRRPKNKKFDGICYHRGQRGHRSKDCWAWRNGRYKKFKKEERSIEGEGDELVLCSLMMDSKKRKKFE